MAKTKILYMNNEGAYVITTPGIAPMHGKYTNKIGRENIYSETGVMGTYTYHRWGYVSGYGDYPWGTGVTVSNFRINVSIGTAYEASMPWGATSGTVSIAIPKKEYSVSMTDTEMYAAMTNVTRIGTCQTDTLEEIHITDTQQMEDIMKYGVVLSAASGSWYATASVISVVYDYTDVNEPPDIDVTNWPSRAFLCDDITLKWNYSQSADVAQSKVDVQLCRGGTEWKTLADKQSVSGHQITVNLKNTDLYFTDADELEAWTFRVRAYAGSNATASEWSETSAVKLQILRPKLISPVAGENRLATEAVRLTWTLQEMPTGTPAGFSVLYSTDAGETWESHEGQYADVIRDGDTWYRDIPANTLPHGIVQWKVWVWTTDNAVSFSVPVETFRAVIQASTSAVSCDGKPIPTLSWTSTSQAAYQVRFGDYDSGAVYGAAKQHTVPYVYADGLYAAQVRTQAITGEWSDWTEETFVQIRNVKPSFGVTLSAQSTRHTVILTWTAAAAAEGYVLYREGVPVYVGKAASFTDRAANGKKTYFVRAVTSAKYYAESAAIIADATPKNDCICDDVTGEWIALRYSSSPRRRSISEGEKVSYKWYAGRKYPVAFTEGYSERTGNFSYCFRRREDAAKLAALSGKTVIYKGTDGTVMYGILGAVQIVGEILYDVSFSVTEIDHTEEVAYEIA